MMRSPAVLLENLAASWLFAEAPAEELGNPWMTNLRELPPPEPVGFWPPGPAWFALAGLLLVAVLWLGWRIVRRRRTSRYRRQALAEVARLEIALATEGVAALVPLPALLKRVALAAYPRTRVAGLYGDAWETFLDETSGERSFRGEVGRILQTLAYDPRPELSSEQTRDLLRASRRWIRGHRPEKTA